MTCMFLRQEPSLTSIKEKPPLDPRCVRTHPETKISCSYELDFRSCAMVVFILLEEMFHSFKKNKYHDEYSRDNEYVEYFIDASNGLARFSWKFAIPHILSFLMQ